MHVMSQFRYAGFWIRTIATFIDSILILAVVIPLLTLIYGSEYWLKPIDIQSLWNVLFSLIEERNHFGHGIIIHGFWDFVLNFLFPLIAVILFWHAKSATPGKLILGLTIVDANTGDKPSTWQFIVRYFAYLVAILPFFLGFFWIAFDGRKQGWHDKLANTLVVYRNS